MGQAGDPRARNLYLRPPELLQREVLCCRRQREEDVWPFTRKLKGMEKISTLSRKEP